MNYLVDDSVRTLSSWCIVASAVAVSWQFAGAAMADTGKVKPMISLTEADNGRTIDAFVGDTIGIKLPENATTGYRWAVDGVNESVVEAAGSKPNYPSESIGSGGDVSFTFKAMKAGSTDLAFKYWRHFEGDASTKNRFLVHLNVQSK